MHIESIWQYPVKTMLGGTVSTAELAADGVAGDRWWAVRDDGAGTIGNARKMGQLMQLSAAHGADGSVVITLPGGATVSSHSPDVNAALSQHVGRPVSLWARPPADDDAFYRRKPLEGDLMVELREIFAREEGEPLPDLAKFPAAVIEYETPPGALYDCYPLLLLTTSTLRSIEQAVPESVVDVRRFRPSLVIDTGDAPGHPEFTWPGRRFAVGSAVVEVINDCPRCAAITRELTPDVPADRAILRHVVKDLDQAVGVYATVVQPGVVTVGDELIPL